MKVLAKYMNDFSHAAINGTSLELYIPVNKDDTDVISNVLVQQSPERYVFSYGEKQQFSVAPAEKPKGKVLYNKYSIALTKLDREQLVKLGETLRFPHSLLLQPLSETIFDTKLIASNGLRAPMDSTDISYYY